MASINWQQEVQRLIRKYKGKRHPLDYNNTYQLVVMVVLSAQDFDRNINKLAPDLFREFPDMKALSMAEPESLYPFVSKVRNFGNKIKWLRKMASVLKDDSNIPATLEGLTALSGIGRKSANVTTNCQLNKFDGAIFKNSCQGIPLFPTSNTLSG